MTAQQSTTSPRPRQDGHPAHLDDVGVIESADVDVAVERVVGRGGRAAGDRHPQPGSPGRQRQTQQPCGTGVGDHGRSLQPGEQGRAATEVRRVHAVGRSSPEVPVDAPALAAPPSRAQQGADRTVVATESPALPGGDHSTLPGRDEAQPLVQPPQGRGERRTMSTHGWQRARIGHGAPEVVHRPDRNH
jgi:hypothetical protein